MRPPGPLLHLIAIALLVGPAVVLLGARDEPARAATETSDHPLAMSDFAPERTAARGRIVYEKYCIGCHGDEGRGDGAASRFLDPLPRNFQKGRFKFRSTVSGAYPTIDDLVHTITCGLSGSSMPGFPLLPEQDRRDVARYVLHLSALGLARNEVDFVMDDEGLSYESVRDDRLAEIRKDAETQVLTPEIVAVPAEPQVSDDLLAKGRSVYDAQCASCHGDDGRGFGPASFTLRDWKNAPIRPRDFTTGVFRAGSGPRDLYLRLTTGVNGTPMPAIAGTPDDRWALVHYIESMRDPDAVRPYTPPVCGHEEGR